MEIYAGKTGKTAGSVSRNAVAPKSDTLNDVVGRVAARADNIRLAVDRITNRLLSSGSEQTNEPSTPPYCNAELDADRADRILSTLEDAVAYLENRIG